MFNTYFDRKALKEVYEILIMLEETELNKIPKRLINTINENKDDEYEVDLNKLREGKIMKDTQKILGALYSYYLSSEEEKKTIFKLINLTNKNNRRCYQIFKNKK